MVPGTGKWQPLKGMQIGIILAGSLQGIDLPEGRFLLDEIMPDAFCPRKNGTVVDEALAQQGPGWPAGGGAGRRRALEILDVQEGENGGGGP